MPELLDGARLQQPGKSRSATSGKVSRLAVNGRSFVSSSILARADEALHQDYSLAPAHVMSDIQIQEVLQNKNLSYFACFRMVWRLRPS